MITQPIIDTLSREDREQLLALLQEKQRRDSTRKWLTYFSDQSTRDGYHKHIEFFNKGKTHHQRCFMAANRVGKTVSGAFELTCHMTGQYPDWWQGRTFDSPVDCWIVGKNLKTIRETLQETLLGKEVIGTGMIPGDCINEKHVYKGHGAANTTDMFRVKHVNGGYSVAQFKTYEMGRQAFEGTAKHVIWLDEECPEPIYGECLTRTATTEGLLMLTFTPLMGTTPLVKQFVENEARAIDDKEFDKDKIIITASWDDVPHLTEQTKARLLLSYPPHMRDARTKGIPLLGAGAIYPVMEDTFLIDPIEIPSHWKKSYALDVGWNRTAALWVAIDPETQIKYIYSEHYVGEEKPAIHAVSIKARGDWIPGCIDPASRGRSQRDGEQLVQDYENHGLLLTYADNAVEAGILAVWEQLEFGYIKVFKSCQNFIKEFRGYHRTEGGKIHKKDDHLMDCLRYLSNTGFDIAIHKPISRTASSNYGMPSKPFRS